MRTVSSPIKLSWPVSFTLDVLRLCAALIVFLHHGYSMWFNNALSEKFVYTAHFSVVIFFVLSGYLIAYTTANNNRGVLQYAQARLSRLCSVLWPAILITAACQVIVYFANPVIYSQYARPHIFIRFFLSSFFMNEVWLFSAAPPINGPLWSMSYEFWYYVIFGLWFYFQKSRRYYLIVLVAILIAGPPILSMMPIWLMGCLAYKLPHLNTTSKNSWLIFSLSILAAVLLLGYMPALPFKLGMPPLYYANQFITDGITGIFLALALYAITQLKSLKPKPLFICGFRRIADLTFPLYLLHYPLLVVWKSFFTPVFGSLLQCITAMVSVLTIVVITGLYIEGKRGWWYTLFGTLLKNMSRNIFKSKKAVFK